MSGIQCGPPAARHRRRHYRRRSDRPAAFSPERAELARRHARDYAPPQLFDFEQPTLFGTNGFRYSAFATNTPPFGPEALSVQLLDARHRVHAGDYVRATRDTGLGRLPSNSWTVNQAWCAAICIAVDLTCWVRLYALTGALSTAEPKTFRFRIFHTPARLTRARRYRWLHPPHTWPWAADLAQAIDRVRRLPMPAT